ncbi:MAG: stage III sporulation protein AE [Eubacterium sp.]
MIKKICLFTILLIFLLPGTVMAEDVLTMDDFDLSDSGEVLRNGGYDDINFNEMIKKIMEGKITEVVKETAKVWYSKTFGNISLVEKTIGNLLLIIILSAFFTNFANVFSKDNISDTGFYICYLVAITIMVTLFESFCILTSDFVKLLLEFIGGIIPSYFLSVAIMGQVSAAGFYQLTLVIIGVSEFVFLKVIIPLIKVYMAISLVNNVSQEDFLSKTAQVICNLIKFINRSLIGIVTGLNIIQGLVLPAVDGAKNTTIRKMIGTLPVIGDGTDAMTGIVLGSVNLIKNTIGTFGIIIIILICLVPFFKIQLYSISLQIITAVIQPVADKRMINSLGCLCNGTKLLTRVIISNGILFILSIAIMCIATNIK